jgi:hypothetical protein
MVHDGMREYIYAYHKSRESDILVVIYWGLMWEDRET